MNDSLLSELLHMQRRDEDMRARLLAEGRLYGIYVQEMQQVHRENAHRLEELIVQHGWPGVAKVGIEGCRAAWTIAQHAICTPAAQRGFLLALSDAAQAGDAPKRLAAMLADRIRFNENRPQLYGTVLDWDEDGELTCELEDPANVDARRAEAGLPPFEEERRRQQDAVRAEGGKPPADFARYTQEKREWARSVGWIR